METSASLNITQRRVNSDETMFYFFMIWIGKTACNPDPCRSVKG